MDKLFPNDENATFTRAQAELFEEQTAVKVVSFIWFGEKCVKCPYYSPLDPRLHGHEVHICLNCLKASSTKEEHEVHSKSCRTRGPPGDLIFQQKNLSIFRVDAGGVGLAPLYCERLALISKLFLDHKLAEGILDNFEFFVLCEKDEQS